MTFELSIPKLQLGPVGGISSEIDPDHVTSSEISLVEISPLESKRMELVKLTETRQEVLSEYRLMEDEELRLVRALEKIREERHGKLVQGREIARQMILAENSIAELERLQKEQEQNRKEALFLKDAEDKIIEIMQGFESFGAAHEYQKTDILFMVAAYLKGKKGFLNANDMGLGKTYEGIVCLYIISVLHEAETGKRPHILWLTKKSLMRATPKEINKWWPTARCVTPLVATNDAKGRESILELYKMMHPTMFLANYEFVRTTPKVRDIEWDLVVIDEVHKLKGGANSNGPTAIWTACKDLCLKVKFNIFLSGTPMVNKPEEMWSYLHIFSPEKFPDVKMFQKHFMAYKDMAGEFKLEVQAKKLLETVLKGQMIARSRYDADVKLELPDVTREEVELEMNDDQAVAYQAMRDQFFVWLAEQEEALTATAIIAQLTRLRQINSWPAGIKFKYIDRNGSEVETVMNIEDSSKVDEAMEIIGNAAGKQVLIFSTFNEPMYEIRRRCKSLGLSCEVISGDTKDIGSLETAFQNEQIDVLCLNSSMGEGLNLQRNPSSWKGGASIGIFIDLWWSPASNEQCEARIVRQGCNEPVNIYILKNVRSVDAFIDAKIAEKKESFDSIMNSNEVRPASDWKDLLEGMI